MFCHLDSTTLTVYSPGIGVRGEDLVGFLVISPDTTIETQVTALNVYGASTCEKIQFDRCRLIRAQAQYMTFKKVNIQEAAKYACQQISHMLTFL